MIGVSDKQEFMAVNDYGTGGLWVLITARSRTEIEARYPILTVLEERPAWMTQAHFEDMHFWHFDIDDTPPEWLQGQRPKT